MAAIPLDDAQKKAAIAIGKAYWMSLFKTQYPNATKEEKTASWKEHRKEYTKVGRTAVRMLLKNGYSISGTGKAV